MSDQLRKAGMDVDLQLMDFATLLRRIASQAPPDKGGWNVHFNILDGVYNFNPAGNTAIRARRLDQGIADFDAVIRIDPRHARAFTARGFLSFPRGN